MSTYRSSPKGQPLHQRNSSDNPANDSESPKAPSTIFNLNYTVLYTTLRTQLYTPNSTQLNSTQPNSSSGISPKSSHPTRHKKQGSVSRQTVDALTAQSVQPQGSHLPKVGGWNQDTIHLEIEEVLEEKKKYTF